MSRSGNGLAAVSKALASSCRSVICSTILMARGSPLAALVYRAFTARRCFVTCSRRPPLFGLGQLVEAQDRHGLQSKQLGSNSAAISGDDHAVGNERYRVHKAEAADRVWDLPHLHFAVDTRVSKICL